ncbi:MAG: hypothetical protein U9Q06_01005, partial [Nanoarchaeota archaeon]|nr:hypothetical protein [Nanoarchaeota archaeon]
LGDYNYELEIDLSELEIMAEEGELNIVLDYEDFEIVSLSTVLSVETPETSVSSEIEEEEEIIEEFLNETVINVTDVNETVANVTDVNVSKYGLTEGELFVLKAETGASEVKITKAEVVNGRLIIRFEIGKYWLENSYEYNSGNELDEQIAFDRARWVKKLAQSLSEKVQVGESVGKYVGSYEL